jgi:hypothetical protein
LINYPSMKTMILIPISIAALFGSGCSTPSTPSPAVTGSENAPPPKSNVTVFEGAWSGHDATPGQDGPETLRVSGHTMEFHGADANDWLKGTFTLREDASPKQFVGVITQCGNQDYVGKSCCAIFEIEEGTLTVSGYQPGVSVFQPAFDAPGSREIVFKHGQ